MSDTENGGMSGTRRGTMMLDVNTPIRVGAVLGVAGFVGGAIWWASALQTKMDYLTTTVEGLRQQMTAASQDHEGRLRALERKTP